MNKPSVQAMEAAKWFMSNPNTPSCLALAQRIDRAAEERFAIAEQARIALENLTCVENIKQRREMGEKLAYIKGQKAAEERYRAVLENILSDAQIDTDYEDVALHALACIRHTVRAALQAARGEQEE